MRWLSFGTFQEHDVHAPLVFKLNSRLCDFEASQDFNGLGTFSYALSLQGQEVDELRTIPLRHSKLRRILSRGLYPALIHNQELRNSILVENRKELRSQIEDFEYDAFFTRELFALDEETMSYLKSKIPLRVLWLSFTPYEAPLSIPDKVLEGFTHIYIVDSGGVEGLRQKGLNAFHLPFAMSDFQSPVQKVKRRYKLGFAGTIYAGRLGMLKELAQAGVDYQFWTGSYDASMEMMAPELKAFYGGRAFSHRMLEVLSQCEMIFNPIHRAYMQGLPDNVLNFRLFESLSVGSLPVCESKPALEELFSSQEIPSYSSPEELLTHIQYFSSRSQELKERVQEAHNKCMQEHLYSHRMARILNQVEMSKGF